MRARLGWALALIIGSIVAAGRPVMAQQAVTVRADVATRISTSFR